MSRKQKVVAMILAGGQGSRLGIITKKLAKPAVPFGGKYRIIDFTLSNCVNSGIETVGVLTQYQPLILNEYIGDGKPWDLDSTDSGVQVLPPFKRIGKSDWYKGTANAVLQNMAYIERYDPEYVVILSGDHIYKMDYSKMIEFHKKNKSVCTIAVISVPKNEAKRFGIMNINPDGSIYEFEEKPTHPKSLNASMGVYVFNTNKLKEYLLKDELDPKSNNDFGKNIIPSMLNASERLFAYQFDGYWKDVGTIDSLWEANMDLLNPGSRLDLSDVKWKIYSRSLSFTPHYIAKGAIVKNSLISDGCSVYGTVESSILFPGVHIEKGAIIRDSIIMSNSCIHSDATVNYSIIGENTTICAKSQIGNRPEEVIDKSKWRITVIEDETKIDKNCIYPLNEKAMMKKEKIISKSVLPKPKDNIKDENVVIINAAQ